MRGNIGRGSGPGVLLRTKAEDDERRRASVRARPRPTTSPPRALAGDVDGGARNRSMRTQLRDWARAIKRDVIALSIAGRDPRIPWRVKLAAMAVAAYA